MKIINHGEEFNTYISSEKPVVIKFFTNWCPDCRRMDMWMGDIVNDFSQINWAAINADQFSSITKHYDVIGIPSLLVFQNGKKLAHLHSANAKTPEQVREFLTEAITNL